VLGDPVDAEQVGVLATDAQYVGGAVDVDTVIAVGDSARQDRNARRPTRPELFDRGSGLAVSVVSISFEG